MRTTNYKRLDLRIATAGQQAYTLNLTQADNDVLELGDEGFLVGPVPKERES